MGDQIPLHPKKFKTELTDFSESHQETAGPYAKDLEVDALIVGAGFAGIFMLKSLRDRGLKTYIFEAGNDIGGTWRWNCYPGAGVDSEVPEYEFSWPEVWKTWNWPNNYPNYKDLRRYFDHVDNVVGIKKDCAFHTVVVGAHFDTSTGRWNIRTEDGRVTKAKYLVLGTGFAARRYIPDWPGMEKFKGVVHHSSFWPDEKVEVKGKRCAVIGTGASGVQIVQAWGPEAGSVKVFQRTPNLAVPMRRKTLTVEEQEAAKKFYPELFKFREDSFAGFLYDWSEKNTFDDSPEERRAFYEKVWADGGFRYWVALYKDNLMNPEANKESYRFWVEKTRARIGDPKLRDLLAPNEMPHYFGIKRPCLEHDYFEQFNRETVDLVDIKSNPIKEFDETGITLQDGTHHEFDVIAVATGFDVVTGVMTQLGLESINNDKLDEQWSTGASTFLGTTVPGYPNMFHIYGPQGPTLLSNGPTTVEVQGRWIVDMIRKMERQNIRYINPKKDAASQWKDRLVAINNATLFPTTKSTYMGGSIPDKVFEPVCFPGGIPQYARIIRDALDTMEGFECVKA
ncbi:putative flavoprotein CzcO associated with the cation diffusion facilitator CzcD [Geosmithia morbida]|uniref:Flavoprotein CzcO associated with the cation diffusion facilitator CzcD n=1 Tax=Geosmithia morbida TaxID=1094350 RepID=A0A9P5CYE6_9HYPO|nr:putative flavoprotein CzcO associated with the cation diffusion facilitator CzcD [Geosmithia morbida]KAF4120333.1 putative flavoprotein CzcO associated with the cation diffusion facilitator CzcD [Geosmithia morbida]